jgi:hypothetical protein
MFMTRQQVQKEFNVTGLCNPTMHYMVDTSAKVDRIIKGFIERGKYFTINRARQYGKTTTFSMIERRLQKSCVVIRLSFEGKDSYFKSFAVFCEGMRRLFRDSLADQDEGLSADWEEPMDKDFPEEYLRKKISELCGMTSKPVILMIDEVDRATDFSVFITFLGLLRDMYLERNDKGSPAFQSVVLACVHDVKNLKKKIRPESGHTYNSPWNIAADFDMDMSFSSQEIATMIEGYEGDRRIGMDVGSVAESLYYYTNGYPFLVSKLCKMIDETQIEWSSHGVGEAARKLVKEKNTLFEDMYKNVLNNKRLGSMVKDILLRGEDVQFSIANPTIELGAMYGIFADRDGKVELSNIIFETVLYDLFLSLEEEAGRLKRPDEDKSLFVKSGKLDLDAVVNRFAQFLKSEYRDADGVFIEEHARLLFLGFLKPIINGTGHYVIEPRTSSNRRIDIIVFYGREKFIAELKIHGSAHEIQDFGAPHIRSSCESPADIREAPLWRGEAYEVKGYDQLTDYLCSQEQKKGWLISFSGNKKSPRKGGTFEHKGFEIAETIIAYREKETNEQG